MKKEKGKKEVTHNITGVNMGAILSHTKYSKNLQHGCIIENREEIIRVIFYITYDSLYYTLIHLSH